MDKLIYTCLHSIPDETCDDIIKLYHEEKSVYGIVSLGYTPSIKLTYDFTIPDNSPKWNNIKNLLIYELQKHLKKYLNNIQSLIKTEDNNFSLLENTYIYESTYMIQRYIKNNGYFKYHIDVNYQRNSPVGFSQRIITYLWYLNDIEEGGETELWYGKNSVIPKKGKLLLFPAHHAFPHAGKLPISSDKYIITGWVYMKTDSSNTKM